MEQTYKLPDESLSDDEILTLAESMMDEDLSMRMSRLAQKQKSGYLDDTERAEMKMLMDIYNVGQLRKAQALAVAVKRGLIPKLEVG